MLAFLRIHKLNNSKYTIMVDKKKINFVRYKFGNI